MFSPLFVVPNHQAVLLWLLSFHPSIFPQVPQDTEKIYGAPEHSFSDRVLRLGEARSRSPVECSRQARNRRERHAPPHSIGPVAFTAHAHEPVREIEEAELLAVAQRGYMLVCSGACAQGRAQVKTRIFLLRK